MVGLSLPVFFARTPEDFLEFTRARKPDPETGKPDMGGLGAWLGQHPEAGSAVQAALAAKPPASYGTCTYHGIHAYRWVSAEGVERHVRFRFEPEAGEAALSAEEARERGPDYLQQEVRARLGREPIRFRLLLQLAEADDPVADPTAAWPAERETVDAGRSRSRRSTASESATATCWSSTPSGWSTASSSRTTPSFAFAPGRTRCRWSGGAAGPARTLRSADSWGRRRPRAG
jgi:catalase